MELLDRNQILDADDLTYEDVEVPEWGGAVRVKSMTGAERDAYELSIIQMRKPGQPVEYALQNARAKLCAKCIIGADGRRLFTDADIEGLGRKSAEALDRVYEVAQRLSGIRKEDVDELAGNFTETTTDVSLSN